METWPYDDLIQDTMYDVCSYVCRLLPVSKQAHN